jgi:hypothetical protein
MRKFSLYIQPPQREPWVAPPVEPTRVRIVRSEFVRYPAIIEVLGMDVVAEYLNDVDEERRGVFEEPISNFGENGIFVSLLALG